MKPKMTGTAKTTAELQREFRARKKAQGLYPVGGIYAPKNLHADIKAAAREVLRINAPAARPDTA
jgi:hypothetical protein